MNEPFYGLTPILQKREPNRMALIKASIITGSAFPVTAAVGDFDEFAVRRDP